MASRTQEAFSICLQHVRLAAKTRSIAFPYFANLGASIEYGQLYDRDVSLKAVRSIYEQAPLSQELVTELNPAFDLEELKADAEEIGYPFK